MTLAGSGSTSSAGPVPRTSNPVPGLTWLTRDTTFVLEFKVDGGRLSDDDYIDKVLNSTLISDEDYIRYFDKDIFSDTSHKEDVQQVKTFLAPTKALEKCLREYIAIFPDTDFY